ncbi:MAG TPA: hypothetical protein VIY48_03995 [Candidatus Paceibacterota bacterium]
MRFIDDKDLSFCLTMSEGIELGELLSILGSSSRILPSQQSFNDSSLSNYEPGSFGLINVFEEDGMLITLENNGFAGVGTIAIAQAIEATKSIGHYVAIYRSSVDNREFWYAEVQDGLLLANFNPLLSDAPEAVDRFFSGPGEIAKQMVDAIEYRMEADLKDEWLSRETDTYVVDYRP